MWYLEHPGHFQRIVRNCNNRTIHSPRQVLTLDIHLTISNSVSVSGAGTLHSPAAIVSPRLRIKCSPSLLEGLQRNTVFRTMRPVVTHWIFAKANFFRMLAVGSRWSPIPKSSALQRRGGVLPDHEKDRKIPTYDLYQRRCPEGSSSLTNVPARIGI